MRGRLFFLVILLVLTFQVQAQAGFKKDSLQIKVYTEIAYEGDVPTKISVVKVFCEYCNEEQLKYLSQKAWKSTYHNRYGYKEKIRNGKAKLAHFIRVKKEDFKKIE